MIFAFTFFVTGQMNDMLILDFLCLISNFCSYTVYADLIECSDLIESGTSFLADLAVDKLYADRIKKFHLCIDLIQSGRSSRHKLAPRGPPTPPLSICIVPIYARLFINIVIIQDQITSHHSK